MSQQAQAQNAINLATKNQNFGVMTSSAKLCLRDAKALFAAGKYEYAIGRAVRSIEYSVGIFHADHKAATA
jgi:uncharacterized protein (UPF0332 family)